MKLELIKPKEGMSYDITKACESVKWSGAAVSAARTVEFAYVNAPFDSSISVPQVSTGDFISLTEGGEEVFYGQIFGTIKSTQLGTISFTATDAMKLLLESHGQYNFKNMTPEAIAAQVCADVQFPIRYLQPTGINIKSMICDDLSLYDIILGAYVKAHKICGDKYFAMVYKRGLGIYKSEWIVWDITLEDKKNITEASLEETMEEIVNTVKIYDSKGKQIGEIKDDGSRADFGIFQQIYKQEEGVDPTTAATGKLKKDPKQVIKISAIGDINCLSCYYVRVKDAATGLCGKYWISSDTHTWQNGVHQMDLELTFEAIMPDVNVKEEEAKKKKEEKKKKGKKSEEDEAWFKEVQELREKRKKEEK